ncbi:helix-turn-helix domain-containing protein [Rothia amarae]|uniref:Helix-turn-helix domain-containing protein n=2 Tax=Rothia amarae TaxID=169480 RepID=A0A7H2BLT7_9MICC|nr:helix-turn-helix domain-containing protein [Rothia amarae]
MSNEAITWAFGLRLPMNEKFVLVALADYADDEHSCFPSVNKTSERVGVTPPTVRKLVSKLAERGLVEVQSREHPHGGSMSNRYILAVGKTLDECRPTSVNGGGLDSYPPANLAREGGKSVTGGGVSSSQGEGKAVFSTVTLNEPSNNPKTNLVGARSAPKGQRVTEDFMPAQKHIDKIRRMKPGLNLEVEHTKFINYWLSKTGKDATKLDWGRTWENWMLTAKEERPQDYKPGYQKRLEYNTHRFTQKYQPENPLNQPGSIFAIERGTE